jgi:hypothetical protein
VKPPAEQVAPAAWRRAVRVEKPLAVEMIRYRTVVIAGHVALKTMMAEPYSLAIPAAQP